MVKQVRTKEEFDATIKSAGGKLVVVDFFANWCGPCHRIAPAYVKFSEKYHNVIFIQVDVEENQETAAEYNISSMPTFLFFRNGDKVNEFSGADLENLERTIMSEDTTT